MVNTLNFYTFCLNLMHLLWSFFYFQVKYIYKLFVNVLKFNWSMEDIMIYPQFLKKGDTIGVTACSDGCTDATDAVRMDNAAKQLKELGYEVIETKNARTSEKARSSDAKTRVNQLKELLEDNRVSTIIMASGGDYLLETLPLIDYDWFLKNPKWLQGYSDPTGLLYTVTVNCDMATVYGCNFGDFGMAEWHPSLYDNIKLLEGYEVKQNSFDLCVNGFHKRVTGLEGYVLENEVLWKNLHEEETITMEGRMLGGCLDVLLSLVGTKYDKTKEFIDKYKEDGIIWYLESFALGSEALFMGLWNLREAGWFEHVKGFIFGRPCFFESHNGSTYEETVADVLDELKVPIILDADFGHKPPRMAIINGAKAKIESTNGKGSITQIAKE